MKERIHYIDVSRGVLILLVILHHITNNSYWSFGIESSTLHAISKGELIFKCFFMQAFFLLSGYCSNFSIPFLAFLRKNIRQLLFPALCLSIMLLGGRCVVYQDLSYLKHLISPHYWAYSFYWFISALFICRLLYWAIFRYCKNIYMEFALLGICLVLSILLERPISVLDYTLDIPNLFFWRNALANLIFLAIGFRFKSYLFSKMCMLRLSFAFICMFCLFALCVGKITVYTQSSNIMLADIPEYVLLAFCGSIFIVYICSCLDKNKFLEEFGKGSLIVYCLHGLFLNFFIEITNMYIIQADNLLNSLVYYVLVAFFTITCCWITIKAFDTHYLSWILGKK